MPIADPYRDAIDQDDLAWLREMDDLTGHWPVPGDVEALVAVVACFERADGPLAARAVDATVLQDLADRLPPGGCADDQIVELRPGYPGYRGLVTGLLGPGDVARVCGLIAADPSFDRAAEDKENRRAGRRLGLSGDPDYWTWEDWMRVDAERNAAPACYACFLFAPVPPSEVAGRSATDWDDPRILAGTWGTDSNCSRYSLEAANLYTDYELRAMVILSVDYHLNATDLVEAYEIVLENLFTVGGSVLPVETYWPIVVKRGGYVPMPDNAHPDDQIFSVYVGAMAVVRHGPPMLQEAMFNRLDSAILEWQSDLANRRSAESLGEWLRSNGAADW